MSNLIEKALAAITGRINLSTGLTHPNDMNAAKEMFVRLHQAGEVLMAAQISTWAVMHGWGKKDANELGALAQQIGMGKKPRIKDGPWWNEDILTILKQGGAP